MTRVFAPIRTCRYCGAPIRWATTAAGKRMPLDAHEVPASEGGRWAIRRGPGDVPLALHVSQPHPDEPLHQTHWATCPSRAQARADADRRAAR